MSSHLRAVITVDIEAWTRQTPGGFQGTHYTLIYTEAGREYRVSTHATEFEARQVARRHGWVIGRLVDGDANVKALGGVGAEWTA